LISFIGLFCTVCAFAIAFTLYLRLFFIYRFKSIDKN